MPSRLMRYTPGTVTRLDQNAEHQFAANFALSLYKRNAVLSFIPKNGCTTLRYSAAIENQVIAGPDQFRWIHANNRAFRSSHRELVTADYTFVVLRCPFERLVSCFLHKVVDQSPEAQSLLNQSSGNRAQVSGPLGNLLGKLRQGANTAVTPSLDDLTFADFIALLETPSGLRHDIHWRPQVDFLVYQSYDDVFRLDEMDSMAATMKAKSGFVLQDSRLFSGHGNQRRERINDGFFGRTDVRTLRELKKSMKVPAYARLYDADLYQRVSRLYQADVDLYASHFGQAALLQLQ